MAGAFVLTLSSSVGQTFFIALFAPQLKAELGLGEAAFGGLYTLATLASAATLMATGRIADRFRVRGLAVAALLALAVVAAAMSLVSSAPMLLAVLFGLRLFGQGFPGHLAITGVGRWYRRRRGRMMSIAILGFPAGEAAMPYTAVTLVALAGWRETWMAAAAALALVSAPLVLLFLRREPAHDAPPEPDGRTGPEQRQWTRAEVLRVPAFFVVLAAVVAPGFVMTGVFFHQATLVEARGWTMAWFAGSFPVYAAVSVATALAAGWLIDRLGASRLLPAFLLPLAAAVTVLAAVADPLAAPAFMALAALTNGIGSTLLGALWAELFGTRHLGAIRSVVFATQVFATALAPGLMGLLLDLGVGLPAQFAGLAVYVAASAASLRVVTPRLRRLAAG